jgi:hypothetical protein
MKRAALLAIAACHSSANLSPDGGASDAAAPPLVTVTATVNSTRFVVREHMLAAGEMQISGEPLAQAMGRDLGAYSRIHIPPDLYFDNSIYAAGPWIDLPGFSTGVESYEYSKQPMNNLAFESGAGTALSYAPLVASDAALTALVQHFADGAHTSGRFVFPVGTYPPSPAHAADNALGWPGIWPTAHVFASFDPAIQPTSDLVQHCSITSDDNPGDTSGGVGCADYECNATTLHLPNRAAQIDPTVTPGADGFSAWKYALWTLNYLQIMHDSTEAAVAFLDDPSELGQVGTVGNTIVGDDGTGNPTAVGTYLGSSDIEGFQAQMFVQMLDARAADWLLNFATADGATLSGFPTLAAALAYDETGPLRWFPGQIAVTESDAGGLFPKPAYALGSADSHLLDQIGVILGYATIYALTDQRNADVGGSQPALAYFDGDPFPADDQLADGESTLHDRALAMVRVAVVNLDRLHVDPASGLLVDDVTMTGTTPVRGTTISTTTAAYSVLALRTVTRTLSSQLELYSNETPDTAGVMSPLDALALNRAANPTETFGQRVGDLLRAQASLLLDQLTDASGRAYDGWDVSANAPIDQQDTLDAHAAAVRGLFAAYLATGDERYRARAIAVFTRMTAVFYDPIARIWSATPAPVDSVEYTPLRFALLQSALREYYELVASRPGNEALEPVAEDYLARLNKLVLNGWDDRDYDRLVRWPDECVNVIDNLPRGGLQMAERTLSGEIGIFQDTLPPGKTGDPTSDRESDCVPEIDDAQLPSALADSVTFSIARSQ